MPSAEFGIVDNDQTYADVYSVFHKNAKTQVDEIFRFFERSVPRIAGPAYAQSTSGQFRVLSVGCGKGQYDIEIARTLARLCPQVSYSGVDINSEHGAKFIQNFVNAPANVSSEFTKMDIMEFLSESERLQTKYDLIIMCHLLYYIKDREALLQTAAKLLNPQGGKLIIVHQSPAGVHMLQKLFIQKVGNDLSQTLSVCDVESILLSLDIPFEGEVFGNSYVNVTECTKYPMSDEGLALLSFFLEKDLRKPESQAKFAQVIQDCAHFLDSSASTRRLRDGTVQRLMFHPVAALIVDSNRC